MNPTQKGASLNGHNSAPFRQMTTPHFDLILFPEMTLLPYAGFTDKLRFSSDEDDRSRQRYCSWRSYQLTQHPLQASSGLGIDVAPLSEEHDFRNTDFVVLFGGRTAQSAIEQAALFRPLLKQIYRANTHIVAIDNAVFCLAECGLLDHKAVTLHWRHQQQLKERYPAVKLQEKGLFVTDGRITTSVGGTATIELAQALLAKKMNPQRAAKGLADMMVTESRNPLAFMPWNNAPAVSDAYVHRALVLMFEHMSHPINVTDISAQVGLSRRQLDRKFLSLFDQPAAAYWQSVRLEQGAWLLTHSTQTIEHIAAQLGYQHDGNFRQQFRRQFGCSPTEYRRQPEQH